MSIFKIKDGVLKKYRGIGDNVTIPDNVTAIGHRAFFGCESITSITLPDSVTAIGDRAFFGCINLTSITIPHSVTAIGESAFEWCSGLTSISIPSSVTYIGGNVFWKCTSLKTVYCGAEKKPKDWSKQWHTECSAKIVWDYDLVEAEAEEARMADAAEFRTSGSKTKSSDYSQKPEKRSIFSFFKKRK